VEEEINKVLNLCKPSRDIEIIDTKNNINAHYKPNPRTFMEDKKDSSMIRMLEDLKRGQIDGMFSA